MTLLGRIQRFRLRLVVRAMTRSEGNITMAAARLGCSRGYLSVFLHRAHLSVKDFKPLEGPDLPPDLRRDRALGVTQRRST